MRRRQYQKPRMKNVGGYWVVQYRDLNGNKRKNSFGPVKTKSKYEAEKEFDEILRPINAKAGAPVSRAYTFGEFVKDVYLPWYRPRWKQSTAQCNEQRVVHDLVSVFGEGRLRGCRKTTFTI